MAFSAPQTVRAFPCRQGARPSRKTCAVVDGGDAKHTVKYRGREIECTHEEKLRDVLLRSGVPLHNGGRLITCRGLGTCGTCAVSVMGSVLPRRRTAREFRLTLPPHSEANSNSKGLRLACQTRVVGDVSAVKFDGFWGHGERIMSDCAEET